MKRVHLVKRLSHLMDVTNKEAELYFATFLDSIMENLNVDGRVVINGFGSFKIKEYKARVMKNPKTGELMQLPIRRKISFKPGKELRERVNAINIDDTEYKTTMNNVQDFDNLLISSAG
jgi:integration host factor subunit beta